MTLEEVQQFCRENRLVVVSQELYETMWGAYLMVGGMEAAKREKEELPPTIKATYNGYTGIAYGRSSFEIRDKNDRMAYHTGFMIKRPMTEDECLEELKSTLKFLKKIHGDKWEVEDEDYD